MIFYYYGYVWYLCSDRKLTTKLSSNEDKAMGGRHNGEIDQLKMKGLYLNMSATHSFGMLIFGYQKMEISQQSPLSNSSFH